MFPNNLRLEDVALDRLSRTLPVSSQPQPSKAEPQRKDVDLPAPPAIEATTRMVEFSQFAGKGSSDLRSYFERCTQETFKIHIDAAMSHPLFWMHTEELQECGLEDDWVFGGNDGDPLEDLIGWYEFLARMVTENGSLEKAVLEHGNHGNGTPKMHDFQDQLVVVDPSTRNGIFDMSNWQDLFAKAMAENQPAPKPCQNLKPNEKKAEKNDDVLWVPCKACEVNGLFVNGPLPGESFGLTTSKGGNHPVSIDHKMHAAAFRQMFGITAATCKGHEKESGSTLGHLSDVSAPPTDESYHGKAPHANAIAKPQNQTKPKPKKASGAGYPKAKASQQGTKRPASHTSTIERFATKSAKSRK